MTKHEDDDGDDDDSNDDNALTDHDGDDDEQSSKIMIMRWYKLSITWYNLCIIIYPISGTHIDWTHIQHFVCVLDLFLSNKKYWLKYNARISDLELR